MFVTVPFYCIRFEKGLLGVKKGFEIPETQAQDIDTNEDWKIAELKFSYILGRSS